MNLRLLEKTPSWEWPADAGATLLDVLRDDRAAASERLIAAELAGDPVVINDDLADALLDLLTATSAPNDLRGRAAISLGPVLEQADLEGFDDSDDLPISEQMFQRITKALRETFEDTSISDEVRRRTLEAAVRAPQDWQAAAVREAYESRDEEWKLTAAFCMRYLRWFDKEIIESLKSTNADIQREAVFAAGNWELQSAWRYVAALLAEDTRRDLLLAAIEASAMIRPDEALERLEDLTESDDEEIAAVAEEAIAMASPSDELEDEESD
jgi:HEAT repeat protein